MKTYTISELAGLFGLSRSTLLYYDKQGYLSPSFRTAANYRRYSEQDKQRLASILQYRDTGLSLEECVRLSDSGHNRTAGILEQQLLAINEQIAALRQQQQMILEMLGSAPLSHSHRSITKQQWVALLSATGLSEEDMTQWHIQFEARMPEAHQDFLESLGIDSDEIATIRKWSQEGNDLAAT